MSWQMHRVFCATPVEFDAERDSFHEAIGVFNEKEAMHRGILFVPVAVPQNMADKRLIQPVIEENIRACTYYALAVAETWGAPERNFERDFALATECAADPDLPMKEAVLLVRRPSKGPAGIAVNAALEFSTIEEYNEHWNRLLTKWLNTLDPR